MVHWACGAPPGDGRSGAGRGGWGRGRRGRPAPGRRGKTRASGGPRVWTFGASRAPAGQAGEDSLVSRQTRAGPRRVSSLTAPVPASDETPSASTELSTPGLGPRAPASIPLPRRRGPARILGRPWFPRARPGPRAAPSPTPPRPRPRPGLGPFGGRAPLQAWRSQFRPSGRPAPATRARLTPFQTAAPPRAPSRLRAPNRPSTRPPPSPQARAASEALSTVSGRPFLRSAAPRGPGSGAAGP